MNKQIPQELLDKFKPSAYQHDGSFLISFEGIEGSGKSTQIKLLTDFFKSKNKKVSYFREPGGTEFGEQLRSAILSSDAAINPIAEAHLFAASRAQLLYQEVLPLLNQANNIVILDRYIDSSIAYQAIARGLGLKTILDIHSEAPLTTTTNCTLYLHIDLETSLTRQMERGNTKDYFEKENQEFYQKLIDGYDLAAKTFPDRIQIIDGTKSAPEVHLSVIQAIQNKLGI